MLTYLIVFFVSFLLGILCICKLSAYNPKDITEIEVVHIPEEPGYTRIDKNGCTDFFLDISNDIIYASVTSKKSKHINRKSFNDYLVSDKNEEILFEKQYRYLKNENSNSLRLNIKKSGKKMKLCFDQ